MATLRKRAEEKGGVPIAPMIDVVFLLLIYFMVASTMEQQEADLSFQLPGTVEQSRFDGFRAAGKQDRHAILA